MSQRPTNPESYFSTPDQQLLATEVTVDLIHQRIEHHIAQGPSPLSPQARENRRKYQEALSYMGVTQAKQITPTIKNRELQGAIKAVLEFVDHGVLQATHNDLTKVFVKQENELTKDEAIAKVKDDYLRQALEHEKRDISVSYNRLQELFHAEAERRHANVADVQHWIPLVFRQGMIVARLVRLREVHVEASEENAGEKKKKRQRIREECSMMSVGSGQDSHVLGEGLNRITKRKASFYGLAV